MSSVTFKCDVACLNISINPVDPYATIRSFIRSTVVPNAIFRRGGVVLSVHKKHRHTSRTTHGLIHGFTVNTCFVVYSNSPRVFNNCRRDTLAPQHWFQIYFAMLLKNRFGIITNVIQTQYTRTGRLHEHLIST